MAGIPLALRHLEDLIGYRFRDRNLLELALTHASIDQDHNERLEFLGDAVLDLVVSALLFEEYPSVREGKLTEWKALLVSRATLSRLGERLGLDRWIRSGGNLEGRHSLPRSVYGNAVEAVLGAVYQDCPPESVIVTCRTIAVHWLHHELAALPENHARMQAKQTLQNWAQTARGSIPVFRLTDFHEHPETQSFQVSAEVGNRGFPPAWGASKKEAERRAAWEAILVLRAEGTIAS
jgi:ribonuclease-3